MNGRGRRTSAARQGNLAGGGAAITVYSAILLVSIQIGTTLPFEGLPTSSASSGSEAITVAPPDPLSPDTSALLQLRDSLTGGGSPGIAEEFARALAPEGTRPGASARGPGAVGQRGNGGGASDRDPRGPSGGGGGGGRGGGGDSAPIASTPTGPDAGGGSGSSPDAGGDQGGGTGGDSGGGSQGGGNGGDGGNGGGNGGGSSDESSESSPGKSGSAPGQQNKPDKQTGEAPGNSGSAPGRDQEPEGHPGGGNSAAAPGQVKKENSGGTEPGVTTGTSEPGASAGGRPDREPPGQAKRGDDSAVAE